MFGTAASTANVASRHTRQQPLQGQSTNEIPDHDDGVLALHTNDLCRVNAEQLNACVTMELKQGCGPHVIIPQVQPKPPYPAIP